VTKINPLRGRVNGCSIAGGLVALAVLPVVVLMWPLAWLAMWLDEKGDQSHRRQD
jgi:hypothetical protein